jgi:dihydroorotate dehydrogenase
MMLDPERSHRLAMRALRMPGFARLVGRSYEDPILRQTLLGHGFRNPIGLAAGFDKDGEALGFWSRLGFGFVEAGTVTPSAQPGNPRPRVHRLSGDGALINSMGFNNRGAAALGVRLHTSGAQVPVGVNIGKGRDTPLGAAAADYARAVHTLGCSPAYFAVNVSSPNTPGLRELQDVSALAEIIDAVREADGRLPPATAITPIFVKVSPDLADGDLDDIVDLAARKRIAGLIAANTTVGREGLLAPVPHEGGLSGAPLRERSTAMVRRIRARAPTGMAIIGVGGVFTAEDAFEKIAAGASLVQVYTALVYEGPGLAARISRGLAGLLRSRGFDGVPEAVGSGVT